MSNEPARIEDEAAEEATSGRRMDPELKVLGAMIRLLDELDEPARGRAVTWLASRYSERSQ